MAVALELRVGHLGLELITDALVLLFPLEAAGAVAALLLKPFLDGADDLLVFVQSDLHTVFTSFRLSIAQR